MQEVGQTVLESGRDVLELGGYDFEGDSLRV